MTTPNGLLDGDLAEAVANVKLLLAVNNPNGSRWPHDDLDMLVHRLPAVLAALSLQVSREEIARVTKQAMFDSINAMSPENERKASFADLDPLVAERLDAVTGAISAAVLNLTNPRGGK